MPDDNTVGARKKTLRRIYEQRGPFIAVPLGFREDGLALSVHAKWLYVILLSYASVNDEKSSTVNPSYRTLVRDSGLRREMIAKALNELEGGGFITRQKRFNRSTVYSIVFGWGPGAIPSVLKA